MLMMPFACCFHNAKSLDNLYLHCKFTLLIYCIWMNVRSFTMLFFFFSPFSVAGILSYPPPETSLWMNVYSRATLANFFGLIMGPYQVDLCFMFSSNKTLLMLRLQNNQIGDAGAASVSGALAYVTLSPFE